MNNPLFLLSHKKNVFRLPLLTKVREKASEGAWFASPDCRIRDGVRAR